MDAVARLFAAGLLVWFALLAGMIAVRILRRDIEVAGFLAGSGTRGGTEVLPERVVAVAVFPAILGFYAISALHADVSGPHPSLPDIPDLFVTALTGSNSLYLAGKIARS